MMWWAGGHCPPYVGCCHGCPIGRPIKFCVGGHCPPLLDCHGRSGEGVGGDGGEVDRDCSRSGEAEGVGAIVAIREVGEVGGGGAVELAAVLEVEEAVGLGQVADGADEGLAGLGVEEGDFKGVAGVEGALVEVGIGEGELEGFGSLGDDEGLAEIGKEGIVFAEVTAALVTWMLPRVSHWVSSWSN